MKKYTCDNHKPVIAEDMSEAAREFAGRKARATFGKAGRACTVRMDSYSQGGEFAEYEAFIGYRTGPNETSGSNVRFTVHAV